MSKLKKEHFCYGAILTAIMEYNPDSSFVLLQPHNNSRKIYHIQTNTSQECVIFFKYAFEKGQSKQSWLFSFSDNDKEFLKTYYDKKIPVFIYLLCGVSELFNSEVAVLRYDEYKEISHKKSITLNKKKNSHNFFLYRTKSIKDIIPLPTNRIEKTFDDLINEEVKLSHGYYCPNCGTKITI